MENHNRKSHRLPGYDYSAQGGYYLTVCTEDRKCILSKVHDGTHLEKAYVELTELGELVWSVILKVAAQYNVKLDSCVIMPNHIHMIIILGGDGRITAGRFVGAVKSIAANEWRSVCQQRGICAERLWQRDYYDHILRNEADLLEKRKYIEDNPDKWSLDELYMASSIMPGGCVPFETKGTGDRKGRPYAKILESNYM